MINGKGNVNLKEFIINSQLNIWKETKIDLNKKKKTCLEDF